MIRKRMFLFGLIMLFVIPIALLAQGTEIDVQAFLVAAEAIFLTGVGGMSVMALVSLIKRWVNAKGVVVIIISVIVSACAVLAYLIPVGFVLLKFIIYTTIVTLAANGIYLFPRSRKA